jgi:hypothetical protein
MIYFKSSTPLLYRNRNENLSRSVQIVIKPDKSAKKEQIGIIFWFLLLMNLLSVFLALIIGNVTGYMLSIKVHFWLILIINLLCVLVLAVFLILNYFWKFLDERAKKG